MHLTYPQLPTGDGGGLKGLLPEDWPLAYGALLAHLSLDVLGVL